MNQLAVSYKTYRRNDTTEGLKFQQAETKHENLVRDFLLRIGSVHATEVLKQYRPHESWQMRRFVAAVLGRIPSDSSLLLELLNDRNDSIQKEAVKSIAKTKGAQAVPFLIPLFRKGPPTQLGSAVAEALISIGDPDAVKEVLETIRDPNSGCLNSIWYFDLVTTHADHRALRPLATDLLEPPRGYNSPKKRLARLVQILKRTATQATPDDLVFLSTFRGVTQRHEGAPLWTGDNPADVVIEVDCSEVRLVASNELRRRTENCSGPPPAAV